MSRTFVLLLTISLISLLFFTSCDGGLGKDQKSATGTITLSVNVPVEEKLLQAHTPAKVEKIVYKATPLFVQDEDVLMNIIGSQPNWTQIIFRTFDGKPDTVGHLRASAGYYQAGKWKIELMALNAGGNPVYYGTTGDVYINAGEQNAFFIEFHGVQSIGQSAALDVNFTSLRNEENLGENPKPSAVIKWLDGSEMKFEANEWTSTIETEGTVRHVIKKTGLPAGEVEIIFTLTMNDGSVITQERVSTILINNETTVIDGTLETGEYKDPTFDITEDQTEIEMEIRSVSVCVELEQPDKDKARIFRADFGSTAVFEAVITGKSADSITWYVDGKEVGKGKQCGFKAEAVGQYTLSSIVQRDEKTASEEVLVVFMEAGE